MDVITRARKAVPASTRHVAGWARVASVPLAVAAVILGVWVTGGLLTDNEFVAKGLTGAWLALAGLAAAVAALRWRQVALPVLGSYLATAALVSGFLLWSSTVDKVVVEDVTPAGPATAGVAQLAGGSFTSGAHSTTGTAALVRRADGSHVVTLTDLDTSPGPDLRVYLVPGDGSNVDAAADLGRLRGNKGTQEYVVPPSADPRDYGAVVIWCRAFSVAFGTAPLTAA